MIIQNAGYCILIILLSDNWKIVPTENKWDRCQKKVYQLEFNHMVISAYYDWNLSVTLFT